MKSHRAQSARKIRDLQFRRIVASNLRIARWNAGVKQHELAAALGVSQQYIHAIETGKKMPTAEAINFICRLLRISWSSIGRLGSIKPRRELGPMPEDMRHSRRKVAV